mgnify:FL=1
MSPLPGTDFQTARKRSLQFGGKCIPRKRSPHCRAFFLSVSAFFVVGVWFFLPISMSLVLSPPADINNVGGTYFTYILSLEEIGESQHFCSSNIYSSNVVTLTNSVAQGGGFFVGGGCLPPFFVCCFSSRVLFSLRMHDSAH